MSLTNHERAMVVTSTQSRLWGGCRSRNLTGVGLEYHHGDGYGVVSIQKLNFLAEKLFGLLITL